MKIPVIAGTIRRRFLLNFRIEPAVMQKVLPAPFEPKLHRGWGIAGICLIRLEGVHPKSIPMPCGINSENAAHRFAVQWTDEGRTQAGVFIPRRDTDSILNHLAGGRIFPGIHHKAKFRIAHHNDSFKFEMVSTDGETSISFAGKKSAEFPETSAFASLADASAFFEEGSLGYSSTGDPFHYDGLLLETEMWSVSPFHVDEVHSSYFADESKFPVGSVEFDHALLMQDVPHEWRAAKELCCENVG